jgi:hypothetical protein
MKLDQRIIGGEEFKSDLNLTALLVILVFGLINGCQELLRFGIFHQKQVFFHEMMVSPCCVMNSIACCALHNTLKSLFVCPSQSETSFFILRFFEVLIDLYCRLSGPRSSNMGSVFQKKFCD